MKTSPGLVCVTLLITSMSLLRSSSTAIAKGGGNKISTIVTWQCLRNHTVVAVNWVDLVLFSVWEDPGPRLHLLDESCKPSANDTHLIWTFSEGQCGAQTVVEGDRKSISNVLWITSSKHKNSSHGKSTIIVCNYQLGNISDVSTPVTNVPVRNPHVSLAWSIHRGSSRKMGKEHSQLTGRVARIYRWKNGRFMYIKLYSVGNRLAGKYNNHVHMTFQNCVLKWEVSPEVDMPKNSSRYLIKQGCTVSNDYLFDHTDSHHYQSVILRFKMSKTMIPPDVQDNLQYVQVQCNATFCFPTSEDRELVDIDLPLCSSYFGTSDRQHKCKPMEAPRSREVVKQFMSKPFTIREQRSDLCSNLDCIHAVNGTTHVLCQQYNCTKWEGTTAMQTSVAAQTVNPEILVPIKTLNADPNSNPSALEPTVIIVACIGSFLCGVILVGVLWLIRRHLATMSLMKQQCDAKDPVTNEVEASDGCHDQVAPQLSDQPPISSTSSSSV